MKNLTAVLAAAVLAACALTACASPGRTARTPAPAAPPAPSAQNSQEAPPSGEISRDEAGDIALREEHSDGRLRYEGEAYGGGMKYEFEMDAATGVIYDWNADLRE